MAQTIDINRLLDYESNGDYTLEANFMSRYHFDDAKKQAQWVNKIKDLRQTARFREGMFSVAGEQQKQAISFLNAWDSGREMPGIEGKTKNGEPTNQYSSEMAKYIKEFGGEDASQIRIEFAPKKVKRTGWFGIDWLAKDAEFENDGLTDFCKLVGMDAGQLQHNGVMVSKSNDTNVNYIVINKTDPNIAKYLEALGELKDSNQGVGYRWKVGGINSKGENIEKDNADGNKLYDNNGNPVGETLSSEDWLESNNKYTEHPENSFSFANMFDTRENHWFKEMSTIDKIKDVIVNARRKQDELYQGLDENGNEKELTFSGTVMPYINADDVALEAAYHNGQIETADYNARKKIIKENVESLLRAVDFAQYGMYATNPDTDEGEALKKVETTNDIQKYAALITNSVGTDQISYSTYSNGRESGIMLTINGNIKQGDKNDITKQSNNIDDVKTKALKIFIPDKKGTFGSEEVLNQDSKYRARKEMTNAEAYGYDINVTGLGKIKNERDENGNTTWYFQDTNGTTKPVNKDIAMAYVNRMLITEDAIDQLNNRLYDATGNLIQGIVDDDGNINESFKSGIKNMAAVIATTAMSELYPKAYSDYMQLKEALKNLDPNSDEAKKLKANNAFILANIDVFNNERFKMIDDILKGIGYRDKQFLGMSDLNVIR